MSWDCNHLLSTVNTVKQTLDEYGVAIIPSLLDANECDNLFNGMWDFLEHVTANFQVPIDRNNESSWKSYKNLYPLHGMLLQHWGIGHAQAIWDVRQNKKIIDVFSRIWKTKKLLTSFDGASFQFPPEKTNFGWHHNDWYHVDQSFKRNGFECVQSWVTALDVNVNDATLSVYEKSHEMHGDFPCESPSSSDWYKFKPDELKFYSDTCEERFICCPKGSMVLWDSRTVHAGRGCVKRDTPNFRCVAYVCMKPSLCISQKQIEKKIKAFNELRTTSHWPDKIKLFPVHPRTYGAEIPNVQPINPPVLSETGERLAGLKN